MPENQPIHIVAFDIPYPPNYGGVIDIYYKIKALHAQSATIRLHCFQYGNRFPDPKLISLCEEVYYYKRNRFSGLFQWRYPHITASRKHSKLLERLMQDDAPILFEGIHCCYYLDHPKLMNRQKLVRMHNVEWQYYQALASKTTSRVHRIYYRWEAGRLLAYDKVLVNADNILCISDQDYVHYNKKYPTAQYISPFHGHEKVKIQEGKGDFCLYHGNLKVPENEEAVCFLLEKVFSQLTVPFVIAGAAPGKRILQLAEGLPHVSVVTDPGFDQMNELMLGAHIHVLPTFQSTGIKLKLINALFTAKHIITSPEMITDPTLESQVMIAKDAEGYISLIKQAYAHNFSSDQIRGRITYIDRYFNDSVNAGFILKALRKE